MDAIILAGGLGTRLKPLTETRPKPIIPIVNIPMVEHIIGKLPGKSIGKVILAVSYKKEFLEEYFREHEHPFEIICVNEEEPLGTGGAIKNVEDHIDDDFLVFNGDVVSSIDASALMNFHRSKGGVGTLALWEVEDSSAYGVVALQPDSRVTSFQEKPKPEEALSNLINAGTYVLSHDILDFMEPGRKTSVEREVFASPDVLERGLYGFQFAGYWDDAGTVPRLLNAQKLIMKAHWEKDHLNFRTGEMRMVGEFTQLDHQTKLFKPLVIGEGCVLKSALIGPWVSLGPGVTVGASSRIENSILLPGVKVGKRAYISNSIIGEKAVIAEDAVVEDTVIGDGERVEGRV